MGTLNNLHRTRFVFGLHEAGILSLCVCLDALMNVPVMFYCIATELLGYRCFVKIIVDGMVNFSRLLQQHICHITIVLEHMLQTCWKL